MSADTTWPVSLTRTPRVSALSEEAPDVLVRSEVDVGPPKLRRRFTGDRRKFTIELDLTRSEVSTFDVWFLSNSTGAGGGSRSFAWKIPRTGAAADFRFLSVPTYRPRAPRADGSEWWLVSFDVEMLPGTDSSIPPPAGGGEPPGGGNWPVWVQQIGEEVQPIDEDGTPILVFAPFEADAPPPVFLLDIIVKNYGIEREDNESGEESLSSGGGAGIGSALISVPVSIPAGGGAAP